MKQTNRTEKSYIFVGDGLRYLVNGCQLCDCLALMASSSDPKNKQESCQHLRLVLEAGPTTLYLSGHYVCEGCGLHFDRPPVKREQLAKSQEPPLAQ